MGHKICNDTFLQVNGERSWFNTGRYCLNLLASVSFKVWYQSDVYSFLLSWSIQQYCCVKTAMFLHNCLISAQVFFWNKWVIFLQSENCSTHWNLHELVLSLRTKWSWKDFKFLLTERPFISMKYHYLSGPVAISEVYKHLLPIC